MLIRERAGGNPSLFYLNYVFPLPILKQVVTMFASVNQAAFDSAHPELAAFVLDRERKYLPPRLPLLHVFRRRGAVTQRWHLRAS